MMRNIAVLLFLCFFCLPAGATSSSVTPRYPVVLVHGFIGFDQLFGIVPYWFGIAKELERSGVEVYVAQVSAVNSSEIRGDQLIEQIEHFLQQTGASKANIIGHSQGGLSARYVAAERPDLVASVTTVGAPHKGSELGDFVRRLTGGDQTLRAGFVHVTVGLLGRLIDLSSTGGYPQDGKAALSSLTAVGLEDFNRRYPQAVPEDCGEGAYEVDGIRYYSWGGVRNWTTVVDPSDVILWLTGLVFEEENDGLVGRCSNHLGMVIRDDYPHNHIDEINQILGLDGFGPFEPSEIYLEHVARLREAGL
ncbi:MAG: triacylglycerol lipase [Pseudomonadota bacterium]|nr:triacylglycerol lipase [Pseudomonadota bacterium]